MLYSNARKGIKKVYIAQILAIIATVISNCTGLVVNIIVGYFDSVLDFLMSPLGIVNVSLGIVSAIAVVLTAVFSCIGYLQASKDEPEFKKSMICILIVAVFTAIGSFFKLPNGMVYTIFNTAGTIIEMFVMAFSVSGIINIAVSCENEEMEKRGDRVMTFILVSYLASSVNAIIYRIFELSPQVRIVAVIIGALDLLLIISQFVVFMSYLRHALNMLGPEKKDE